MLRPPGTKAVRRRLHSSKRDMSMRRLIRSHLSCFGRSEPSKRTYLGTPPGQPRAPPLAAATTTALLPTTETAAPRLQAVPTRPSIKQRRMDAARIACFSLIVCAVYLATLD